MALTLFVENLTVLDCSLLSADQGIQGGKLARGY